MAPIINTDDPRATRLLDAAGIKYTIGTPGKTDLVVPVSDFWEVPNIHYRGNTLTADLSKKLLPARTQKQHAEHRNPTGENDFVTMDMPFYIAMFNSLFEQRNSLAYAGQARDFIQETIRKKFPITLTRIGYPQRGKDKVTHNYGTTDEYCVGANIVGPDRIIQKEDREATNAVLGTRDICRLHKIFNWLNKTDLSIYRLNEKPQELTECVARLGANPGSARVDCYRHLGIAIASLGVRVNARSAQKSKK